MKKRTAIFLIATALTALFAGNALAAGSAAGTLIANQATLDYVLGGSSLTANSNVSTLRVAELINLTLTWQDALPGVTVSAGQTGRVTTYRLTNVGNGTETFGLSTADAGVGGDDFDPTVTAVHLDTNGNGVYDAGTDILHAAGTNDPVLAADGGITIFLLSSIPAAGLNSGDSGNVELTATSATGTGSPGTVLAGQGDGGGDAVIGPSGGTRMTTGTYIVSGVSVTVTKSATVIDQYGGSQPMTGATIRYTLAVTIAGSGTAVGVVITDPVPANTTYRAGTLRLGGTPLTDAADGDAGDVGGTTAGTATVGLGDLTSASPVQTITFDVRID